MLDAGSVFDTLTDLLNQFESKNKDLSVAENDVKSLLDDIEKLRKERSEILQ